MTGKPQQFHPALLIVDMQNDFCPPDGSLAVPNGRSIIPTVNTLLSLPGFKTSIATKDWHPKDHISFASNHPSSHNTPFTSFCTVVNPMNETESYETRLWPEHCIQNTEGARIVDGLDPDKKITLVIEKGADPRVEMYSAFYDPFTSPRISDSGLSQSLRDSGITWVYVVGLALDYCVKASALDARNEGFEVVLVREASKAVDGSPDNVASVEAALIQAGVRVVSLDSEEVQWLKE